MTGRRVGFAVVGVAVVAAAVLMLWPTGHEEPLHPSELRDAGGPSPIEAPATVRDAGGEVSRGVVAPPAPAQTIERGEPALSVGIDGGTLPRDEVERVVKAVAPIVEQCFADLHGRYRDGFSVELSFAISEAADQPATLSRGEVSKMTVEDPYLRACLEDAPLDTHVESREVGAAAVRVPFRIGSAGR